MLQSEAWTSEQPQRQRAACAICSTRSRRRDPRAASAPPAAAGGSSRGSATGTASDEARGERDRRSCAARCRSSGTSGSGSTHARKVNTTTAPAMLAVMIAALSGRATRRDRGARGRGHAGTVSGGARYAAVQGASARESAASERCTRSAPSASGAAPAAASSVDAARGGAARRPAARRARPGRGGGERVGRGGGEGGEPPVRGERRHARRHEADAGAQRRGRAVADRVELRREPRAAAPRGRAPPVSVTSTATVAAPRGGRARRTTLVAPGTAAVHARHAWSDPVRVRRRPGERADRERRRRHDLARGRQRRGAQGAEVGVGRWRRA